MDELWKKVEAREKELKPLYEKYKIFRNRYQMSPYQMLRYDKRTVAKNVDNMTLPEGRLFIKRLLSRVSKSDKVITLKGKGLTDAQRDTILAFTRTSLDLIDKELIGKQISRLIRFLTFQTIVCGAMAYRVWVHKDDKGNIHYGVVPFDMLFTSWEFSDTLDWMGYRMSRSKAAIEVEYKKTISSKMGIVIDYLDKDKYTTMVDKEKVDERPNPFGEIPAYLQFSNGIYYIPEGNDAIKYMCESVVEDLEGVYDALNKWATIEMTNLASGFRGALQFIRPQNSEIEAPKQDIYGAEKVIDTKGGEFKRMPFTADQGSGDRVYQKMDSVRQRASISDINAGQLNDPLAAVAIAQIKDANNEVLEPIVDTLELAYPALVNMVRKQFVQNKFSINSIGQDGKETVYKYTELDKDIDYDFKFYRLSPYENVTNAAIANALSRWYDDDTLRDNVLHIPNEGEVQERIEIQRLRALLPDLDMYLGAKALIARGRNMEAFIVAQQIGLTLEEIKSGKLPTRLKQANKQISKQPFNMGVSSNQQAAMLSRQARQQGLVPTPSRTTTPGIGNK